jgi:hypothetical protein
MVLKPASQARPVFRFGTRRQQERRQPENTDGTSPVKHKTLHTLYGYWNEVRAGRMAPQRLEIEPSRIAGILSETFILERIDAGTYQFRLAGTRLCELFGSELRGRNFLDGWSDQDRPRLERDLATICEQGAVGVLELEGSSDGRHRVELEALLLPLTHGGSQISRIIGAMSPTSSPYWLDSEPLRSRHLLRHELIWPDGRPHAVVERQSHQSPFLARAPSRGTRSSGKVDLRVLQGGRSNGKPDDR